MCRFSFLLSRMSICFYGGEAAISLPIFNYGNYYAADENGQPFTITSGENERIVLTIPANYTGTVRVWYQAPGFWRVFEVISALTFACRHYLRLDQGKFTDGFRGISKKDRSCIRKHPAGRIKRYP